MAGRNDILAKLAIQISGDNAKLGASLNQSSKQLNSFLGNVKSVGVALGVAFGGQQVISFLRDTVNQIADFQQQLQVVKAITGATDKEFDQLSNSALKLGRSTQFTAKNVAELQTEFGRLGFTVPEILNATEATIDLATATGEDLAKSADTAGSTIRGFGLDASETRRVVDVMAESFNKSALGLENFTEAMKYVAPIAKSANLSVEETTALLGTLADAGIRGSQAGTSLRKIITDLAKDGRPLAARLKELADRGLSFAQANDEVGRTAYASLLVLTQNQKKTEDLTKALNDASGAAKETADIVGDTLTGDIKKLTGAYDGLIQSGGGATDVLREFVQAGTDVLNMLNGQNGILGEYTEKWLKLAFIVPRTVAKIISGINDIANKSLNEAVADFNEDFGAIPEGEDAALFLGKRAKALEELKKQAAEANVQITDFSDSFGKMVVIMRDAPAVISKAAEELIKPDDLKPTFETIQSLEEKVKSLRKVMEEETPIGDTLALQSLQKRIDDTLLKIELLRNKIAGVRNEIDSTALTRDTLSDNIKGGNVGTSLPQFSVPPIDSTEYINSLEKIQEKTVKFVSDMKGQFIDLGGLISGVISGIADAIGYELAEALDPENVKPQDFGKAILSVIAKFATQLGEIMIATGVGLIALESGNPYAMIIGGAALVAAGAALSALSKQRENITDTISSPTNPGRVSYGLDSANQERINFTFRIEGTDLVAVIDKTNKENGRLIGTGG